MYALMGEIKIPIFNSHSLKEKRMIVRSIKDSLSKKFNLSIAEVGENDNYQMIIIGFAAVSNNFSFLDDLYYKILDMIEEKYDLEIIEICKEIRKCEAS